MRIAWTHRKASIGMFVTIAIVCEVAGFLGSMAGQRGVIPRTCAAPTCKETVLVERKLLCPSVFDLGPTGSDACRQRALR